MFRPAVYLSNDVPIPDTFLTGPPATPITVKHIDFANSPLTEYEGCTAVILENVLSQEECDQLLQLAEASVPIKGKESPWKPAMVNVGVGIETAAPGYRESDRIVWDEQQVTDRLWARCCLAEGIQELTATVPAGPRDGVGSWRVERCNKRMRFLKYSPGQFFKHGPYWYEDETGDYQTQYTVHLYLNDSAEANPESDLVGGATSFLVRDPRRDRVDVNPRAGSVLIFQHSNLLHEGAKVTSGVKYTVRTDVIYKWVPT